MLRWMRTLLFRILFIIGSVPYVVLAFATMRIWPWGQAKIVRGWSKYHLFIVRWILGIKLVVKGQLTPGPVLYVVKHESMFETVDTLRFFDWPAVIAKKELFAIPLWGRAARSYGMIEADREGGAKALRRMMEAAKAAIAQGRPIILFPEGTRVKTGEMPPLQSGFAGLYKMLKLPVVPIALDSGKLMPRTGPWSSGVLTYHICEMIPAGLPREEAEARVYAAINHFNISKSDTQNI
ncbi:1-acyl-sn-glycerol-3-phosphate acyltransferase [Sphingorhabdus lutea]|uniref:1-acyl-sn-glycerol-3-phosphate acyltransferase n=1 Tax=Sphingorhabdus lutea TaxID=1913578 RepID=A0A1L3J8P5_9SPHN|nr:lysophospholipid acyltransferase family protein [Sphingorhabdus lutea]APG61506.1 1-acyl-sn-glycerol-3-phosphate acyltransferase [Sphingorhabdus lutea]